MAASAPTSMDESVHVLFLGKFENEKKYKEEILHEIKSAICGMLNSKGGKVMIHLDTDSSIPVEGIAYFQTPLVIRILEQHMISIIGLHQTVSKINFSRRRLSNEDGEESIVVSVQKGDFLVTTSYNLILPGETQVGQLSSTELPNDIINRKIIEDPIPLGSHWKTFQKAQICGLQMESKVIQFKYLKAEQSKRTTLADRMMGKGNKFSWYVSAFANYRGGHIYYGITDKGVVEGESIPKEMDKGKIIMKIEKAINKMIWPEHIGKPKRGGNWEIFFEPVEDENCKPVPSTFVIVIYIASCLGGVFTEEPECYEMVEGEVEKMSLFTWRKRILGPDQVESVPQEIARSLTWISKTTKELSIRVFCELTLCLNDGDLDGFEKTKQIAKIMHPNIVEVQLVVLLKDILACSRKHDFKEAKEVLEKYNNHLTTVKEHRIFEVLSLYVQAAYNRAEDKEGNKLDLIRDLLVGALAKTEWLMPGLVTALVYLFAGTMTDRFENTSLLSPNELSNKALEHLQKVKLDNSDVLAVHADLTHRAHITRAASYLGFNLSGKLTAERADNVNVDEANSSILAIEQSIAGDNRKLTHYRDVQLKLVKSFYFFRCSQKQPKDKEHFMQEARKYSDDAEEKAEKWNFHELVSWCKTFKSLLLRQ